MELETPYKVEARYGGPEYETLGTFGSDCGVGDLAAICKANELCQRYGLDTIGAGAALAFAMNVFLFMLVVSLREGTILVDITPILTLWVVSTSDSGHMQSISKSSSLTPPLLIVTHWS